MKRVLLFVEDDRDDAELTLLGFRGFEHEIVVVRDGQEALDWLASNYAKSSAQPAAILTDLKMPRMDGLELLHHLKEDPRLRDIPVIFLTSSGNEGDQAEAARLGAAAYFRKPSDLGDYAEIVGRTRELMAAGKPRARMKAP